MSLASLPTATVHNNVFAKGKRLSHAVSFVVGNHR